MYPDKASNTMPDHFIPAGITLTRASAPAGMSHPCFSPFGAEIILGDGSIRKVCFEEIDGNRRS
ncbi:MAG: hypothetical protein ACM3NP_11845 [Actinomycetota bacterium]